MTPRTARRVAWSVTALTVVLAGLTVAFGIANGTSRSGNPFAVQAMYAVGLVFFPVVGGLIASGRPESRIWPLLCGVGVAGILNIGLWQFAVFALLRHPGSIPGGTAAAWASTWMYPATSWILPLLVLMFPTGRLPSPRWRSAVWMAGLGAAIAAVGQGLTPGLVPEPTPAPIANPLGIEAGRAAFSAMENVGNLLIILALILAVASMVVRYRGSGGEERLQLKWFAYAGALVLASVVAYSSYYAGTGGPHSVAAGFVFGSLGLISVMSLPAAIGIAILKYRLYDIDLVINKTLVYGSLAGFITAVYVGIVVGIGAAIGQGDKPNLGLSILATAIVAVAFQPMRERVQRLANRLVYGKRATPYEVLSQFSSRMATTYGTEDLLPRMAGILAEGTGAARADVWLAVGRELRLEASSVEPAGRPSRPLHLPSGDFPLIPEANLSVPVRDRGEVLGALAIAKPKGEAVTQGDRKLLSDLASQAGLVLRNVKLIEEIRASRQRIVSAQDEERRRLERNIHDGAQQQLVALNVKLGLARALARKDLAKTEGILTQLRQETQDALDNLRDLARGIYPPLLSDQGLRAALEAQAGKSSLPVTVDSDGIARYSQDVEAAVYFCTLEALQNVAKYARATKATVTLSASDGHLMFTVTDDGSGFDTTTTSHGTGLQGMADRLEALGGSIEVRSAPGEGTTVAGRLPVRALEAAGSTR